MLTPSQRRCSCVCWFRSQQTRQHYSQPLYADPHDSISHRPRHFPGMHFNIILQCMWISSKLHITWRCSGQNVTDFKLRNACYITHPSLLSHIFIRRCRTSAWKLQIENRFSFNFVKLPFFFFFTFAHLLQRCVLKFFPSDDSPRVTPTTIHVSHPHKRARRNTNTESEVNADTVFWNLHGSSTSVSHHLLHCSCLSLALKSHRTAVGSMATARCKTRRNADWAGSANWTERAAQYRAVPLNPL
jgi:hypothetical protein